MKAEYIQKGETLEYKNETEDVVEAGDVVVTGSRAGIAGTTMGKGMTGSIHMTGVFRLVKKAGEAIAMGVPVYFAESGVTASNTAEAIIAEAEGESGMGRTGEAVVEEAGLLPLLGYAAGPATADSGYVMVKLLG